MGYTKLRKFTLILIRLSGQNIENDGIFTKFCSIFFLISVIYTFTVTIIEMKYVVNIDMLPDLVVSFINYYIFLFDLIVYRMNIKKLQEVFKVDNFLPIDYISTEVMNKQKKVYNFVYKLIILITFIGFSLFITVYFFSLSLIQREFPYKFYHVVADYKSSPYFEIMYILIAFNGIVTFMLINGLFNLFYGFLSIIYCQILMLKILINDLNMDNIESYEEEEECYQKLKFYIKRHTNLLKYFKDINEVYSLILFNQALLVVVSCAVQLYIIAKTENQNTVWNCVTSIGAYMGHFFIQCSAISVVSTQMESLSDSMYGCNWTNNPSSRIKNVILMVIHRSQIGCKFKAGGLNDINMGTFTSVAKLTFSFYTLLKSLQNK